MSVKISDLKPNQLYYSVGVAAEPEGELVVSTFVYLGRSQRGEYQFAEWKEWSRHTRFPTPERPLAGSNYASEIDENGAEVLTSFVVKNELIGWIQSTLDWK
jgi:hypothetical protein